jgi:hypothetical protein
MTMTNSSTHVKTPEETIAELNAAIVDISQNLEKTNLAHSATKSLAGEHIGALRTQLANCKCPGVHASESVASHDWQTFPETSKV